MKLTPDSVTPSVAHAQDRRRLAQRVLDAHRGIDDSSLLAFVSGSVADGLADARSDIDLCIAWDELPDPDRLQQACRAVGGSPWVLASGEPPGTRVAFQADGIEVQLIYVTHEALLRQLDALLVRHEPDSPVHRLADGILRAEPLFGHRPLQALQARLADFPPPLALAMARHFSTPPTPWQTLTRLVGRDAALWCRELQVQACYRLLGQLAALNTRYYSTLRNQRLHHFAASLERCPPGLADRIESLLAAPPRAAAIALHALEGEVLDLLAPAFPALDLAPVHAQRASFSVD